MSLLRLAVLGRSTGSEMFVQSAKRMIKVQTTEATEFGRLLDPQSYGRSSTTGVEVRCFHSIRAATEGQLWAPLVGDL